jgi:hypothetical protein
MNNTGVANFFYTRDLPERAVAIAKVRTPSLTASDLTDINNFAPLQVGTLGIWRSASNLSSAPDFTAPDYNQPIQISGDTGYYLENQFFEITSFVSPINTPLFYVHTLPPSVTNVTIVDLTGAIVAADVLLQATKLYHSMNGGAYKVRYIDQIGAVHVDLLHYDLAVQPAPYAPGPNTFVFFARNLLVNGTGVFYVRFTDPNGLRLVAPYGDLPNAPWFARVRYGLKPLPPEWARQVFLPQRPYMLATWVPGTVLASDLIEFDRKDAYYDPQQLPDILVFDKDNAFKFALDGSGPGAPKRRGSLYNWKRGLVKDLDPTNARVQVGVELALDDICYAFYAYRELDILYTNVDVNPFTNQAIRNRVVKFYQKTNGLDPFTTIYHEVYNGAGQQIATSDTSPGTGTKTYFGEITVGSAITLAEFEITDSRVRGGGLDPSFQSIPQAANFWDLGNLDGKPYPVGGALVVYLPSSILDVMSKGDVESRVKATLPMGTFPVIRFYTPDGTESV